MPVRALGRAMVVTNEMGGSHQQVKHALLKIENAGGSEGYVRKLALATIADALPDEPPPPR